MFHKRTALAHVYTSNKLEQTLPLGASEHDTYKLLDNIFDDATDIHENDVPASLWDAEGGGPESGTKKAKAQLLHSICMLSNT